MTEVLPPPIHMQQQLFQSATSRPVPKKIMYAMIRRYHEEEFPTLVAWLDKNGKR